MANNGKNLEKVVYLVQQVLKTDPNAKIYQNYFLLNDRGEKREFDVVIQTSINDFQLTIVIECKDYNKAVSVDKIEAFEGKCNRVKAVSKKVFISTNGFQSGALTAAADFCIELYQVEDFNPEVILSWFPIKRLGVAFEVGNIELLVDLDEEELNGTERKDDGMIHFEQGQPSAQILKMLRDLVYEHKDIVWSHCISRFLDRQTRPELPEIINLPINVKVKNAFVWSLSDTKIVLLGLDAIVYAKIIEREPDITSVKSYSPMNGKTTAHNIKIKLSEEESADLILTDDKKGFFYTDKKGKVHELVELGDYHPKTGKFE